MLTQMTFRLRFFSGFDDISCPTSEDVKWVNELIVWVIGFPSS